MANEAIDERIGIGPFELRAVLPVVLGHENEGNTKEVLDVRRKDIPTTDAPEGGAIGLELEGKEVGSEGTAAEPPAGGIYVEHAAENFCVEVARIRTAEGEEVAHILACAEEGDEVCGGTEGLEEGDLESDALQDLDGDGEERGVMRLHGCRRGEGKDEQGGSRKG